MKRFYKVVFALAVLFLIVSSAAAQVDALREMTMVVPAESLTKVIKPLLPYPIDLGKNFLGSFFVQSIENIRINNGKILFSSLISGKDVKFTTKIGKQIVSLVVGDVNLPSRWEVSFRYDKSQKTLFIKPDLVDSKDEKEFSQGDALLNTLLTALSGIEYPVELNNLKPVTSEFLHQSLTLNTDIADVYGADNKLFIELIPRVQIDSTQQP
ncbi:MAG: hypothetical protein JSW26_13880 [Desulfobacterales bacterium]|nr:MAG: hypothetical protein JSW26_13880 [Desulfobacterales bacterium]